MNRKLRLIVIAAVVVIGGGTFFLLNRTPGEGAAAQEVTRAMNSR